MSVRWVRIRVYMELNVVRDGLWTHCGARNLTMGYDYAPRVRNIAFGVRRRE